MYLQIIDLSGNSTDVEITEEQTILDLKKIVGSNIDVPPEEQKLIFGGRPLADGETMLDANLFDGARVMMIKTSLVVVEKSVEPEPYQGVEEEKPFECASIPVVFQHLSGKSKMVEIPYTMNFADIKVAYLQKAFPGVNAIQMRLIYAGALVENDSTPEDYKMQESTCVHIVREPDENILNVEIDKRSLVANCPHCHTRGAPLSLRPQCSVCGDFVMLDQEINEDGTSIWNDLIGCTGKCFTCKDGVNGGKIDRQQYYTVDVDWRFRCMAKLNGDKEDRCWGVDRNAKQMVALYRSKNGESLVDILNQLFSYAHGNGMQVVADQ